MTTGAAIPAPRLIDLDGLGDLYRVLVAERYRVIGPAVQDGAIVLRELSSAAELPYGWGVRLEPGGYQLRRRDDTAAFGHAAGPITWYPSAASTSMRAPSPSMSITRGPGFAVAMAVT